MTITKNVEKKIDVNLVVNYLNKSFQKINQTFPKANRDNSGRINQTYKNEVEFAHLINDIQRGPEALITHYVAKANAFLDDLNKK